MVVRSWKSWQTDHPCKYPGPEQGLYVGQPNIHPICNLLENRVVCVYVYAGWAGGEGSFCGPRATGFL